MARKSKVQSMTGEINVFFVGSGSFSSQNKFHFHGAQKEEQKEEDRTFAPVKNCKTYLGLVFGTETKLVPE